MAQLAIEWHDPNNLADLRLDMTPPRGPDDYAREIDYRDEIIQRLIERGSYREGSESALLKWILGILSALLVASIANGITTYADVQTLKAQVGDLKRLVEPRYRGGSLDGN